MLYTHKTKRLKPTFQRPCHRCGSSGLVVCHFCSGTGYMITGKDMRGNPIKTRCTACFGTKTSRCYTCGGSGFIESE